MRICMQDGNFTLRSARIDEADRVLKFYELNREPFLLPRPATDFQRAVTRGQHFIVEQNKQIVAASGVFDYADNIPFVELSETLVLPSLRGCGLQGLFFRLRIASVVVTQGPDIGITTAIDPENSSSILNMKRQGFKQWSAVIPEAYVSCPTCHNRETALKSGRQCCCDFYILPIEKKRTCVCSLLDETFNKQIELRGKAKSIRLDSSGCHIVSMTAYRAALQDFAEGTNW